MYADEFYLHKLPSDKGQDTKSSTSYCESNVQIDAAIGTYVSPRCLNMVDGMVYSNPSRGLVWQPHIEEPKSVWDLLHSWTGVWMWETIYPDHTHEYNTEWIVTALWEGTLMGAVDGSYNRRLNGQICGAGWIHMDRVNGHHLVGSFMEHSWLAGSYQGELLGICALNAFILTICQVEKIMRECNIQV